MMATLAPTSALTSVDLPAFVAPSTVMKPQRRSAAAAGPVVFSASDSANMGSNPFTRQQRRRRCLLGNALRSSLALRGSLAYDYHFSRETRRMIWALARHDGIFGQRQTLTLGPFLWGRFGVDRHFRHRLGLLLPEFANDCTRFLEAAVDKYGAEKRFGGVCEDRRLFAGRAG